MTKQYKKIQNYSLTKSDIKEYDNKKIIDYNDQDFRAFWVSGSKKILNNYENKLLKKMIQNNIDGWFFDIGCGFGRNIPSYYNKNDKFVLLDYALNHLEMAAAENKEKKNIYYIAADAYNLPFKNDVFNFGISIRVLHHLNRPIEFIESLNRILKNNKYVVITFTNRRNFFRIFKYRYESFKKEHSELSEMIYGTHPKLFKRISVSSGFDIKKIKGSGFIHQIANASEKFENFISKHKRLNTLFVLIDIIFNYIFGSINLSLVQFVLLKKNSKNTVIEETTFNTIEDILKCPVCNEIYLVKKKKYYHCIKCKRKYPIKNKIIDFRIQ